MNKIRIIARIDVKNEFVIKGIHLEGLRKVGNPNEMSLKYYESGIDEIVFMDAVAAYYDRNSLSEIIEAACKDVFIPITVGGGIRSVKDIHNALNSGADKVAINTQAINFPDFISEAASIFGSQCIVVSIEAKYVGNDKWEAFVDNGREPTGLDVVKWAVSAEKLGAGEIMLTSIDGEGTKKGFDEALYSQVVKAVSVPVIASGGAGKIEHISSVIKNTSVDAVAIASILHYGLSTVPEIKQELLHNSIEIRK
ncbi:MAG: cyclase [Psychroserpens sp.]|jgi:cyclase